MNVKPISFSGLWVEKGTNNGVKSLVYRPFANENLKDAQKEVDSYNGKTLLVYDIDEAEYDYEPVKLSAKLGDKLNITEEEYRKADTDVTSRYCDNHYSAKVY